MQLEDFIRLNKISRWEESEQLEWKKSTDELKEIVQTVVAFANRNGGIVICGVTDDGQR